MYSLNWKYWKSTTDPRRCKPCEDNHGKIYAIRQTPNPKPPLHINCRCIIAKMRSITAGKATKNGTYGADWCLKYYGRLPMYYISETQAKTLGYKRKKGNLSQVAPGKMLAKGVYYNDNGHLPQKSQRIWYEADINYTNGYRGLERIVYSNDGLIFVTYDHYETFVEIV